MFGAGQLRRPWPRRSGRRRPRQPKYVEAEGLRIAYFDPSENYLVPYATQCFVNSLRAQQRLFGYTPDGGVSILLQDFSDTGNASISGSPRNRAFVDIAPQNLAFETFSPGERMYTKANHELVHLVTSEMANEQDRRLRRLFQGKVAPVAEHPESILYQYLTVPRIAAPRWYQEGSAVFMETWMGGGLGRAQGGYDEMVFRAMVRDDAQFYDPLGLVSKGTEVDFQAGANAYLYGTRFMSYLALVYSPSSWWPGGGATTRHAAITPTISSACSGCRSRAPGRTGSPGSTSSSARISPRSPSIRSRRITTSRAVVSARSRVPICTGR